MLLKDFIRQGTDVLKGVYAGQEAEQVISIICEHFLGVKNYTHIVEPEYEIDEKQIPVLKESLSRLSNREPVQYVTGEASFGDLVFKVNPSVLIPRPETELLVREAVSAASRMQRMRIPFGKNASPVRISDLCTGSGCIAWSIALGVPGVEVVAVDISENALSVASTQPFATLLKEKHANAPKFIKADVLDVGAVFSEGLFDIIVSNPPYIMQSQRKDMKANVLDYEPSIALFAPEDDPLAFYRAIAVWAERSLATNGLGIVEINDELGPQTRKLFLESGFKEVSLVKDFYERDRIIKFMK